MRKANKNTNVRKTVLITGGAGFIGSHLCDFLLDKGYKVICLDNLLTGQRQNIESLLNNKKFKFVKQDVNQPFQIKEKIDYILHLASPASPKDYLKYPLETLKAGSLGTLRILELARKNEALFLLASSSEVYGDSQIHPQKENYWGYVNPIGPRSVYDEAKRYAEALTMAYYRKYGLEVRIARIFNTYGPRMRSNDGRALPNFFVQALKNKPLTVYGDGSQTRSLCYISDMVEGLHRLMLSGVNEPINLGNSEEVKIIDLAREIIKATGSRSEIIFYPLPQDDPKRRCPDISQAQKFLKWTPNVRLKNGLKKVLPYFQSQINEKN